MKPVKLQIVQRLGYLTDHCIKDVSRCCSGVVLGRALGIPSVQLMNLAPVIVKHLSLCTGYSTSSSTLF